jgi:hypothetical protein
MCCKSGEADIASAPGPDIWLPHVSRVAVSGDEEMFPRVIWLC